MDPRITPKWIFVLQVMSVGMIWVFALGISVWILHLVRVAHRWNDSLTASVGISIVAIPVFLTGAAVLTYVFVGLHRGARDHTQPPVDVPKERQ